MMPLLRMAMPRGARGLTVDTVEVGRKVGRCRLYLFGIVPFDHDDLMLAELEPGRRFLERSTMASMRTWEHERTLTADGARRTLVHDRVRFEPRGPIAAVPGLPGLLERVLGRSSRTGTESCDGTSRTEDRARAALPFIDVGPCNDKEGPDRDGRGLLVCAHRDSNPGPSD